MKKTLLVCSRSTRKYFPDIDKTRVITGPLSATEAKKLHNSEDDVIAVGGGAVIDAAKIICKNPIVCYPTTAAGTVHTKHSVVWDGHNKISISVPVPDQVIVKEEFLTSLPFSVTLKTTYDAVSHCLDSLWSTKRNDLSTEFAERALSILLKCDNNLDLVNAGNLAGRAIAITPTTILHSLSYPLTGLYGIDHGLALGFLLESVCDRMGSDVASRLAIPKLNVEDFDVEETSKEALKYSKLQDTNKVFKIEDVKSIYRESITRNNEK